MLRISRFRCLLVLACAFLAGRARAEEPAPDPPVPPAGERAVETDAVRPRGYIWGRSDYLLWWTRNPRVPLLVTTGLETDPRPGAVGSGGTRVLYGGGNVDYRDRAGGRFSFGVGLDRDVPIELEAGYFLLNARTTGFEQASLGSPVIARPFFNALAQQADSSVVAFPGALSGAVSVANDSFFQGAEANVNTILWKQRRLQLTFLAGFRYLDLNEGLVVNELDIIVDPMSPLAGGVLQIHDSFSTRNRFYGGQVGMRAGFQVKRWTFDFLGKFAVGSVQQTINVTGSTSLNGAVVADSGFLALASNVGQYQRDRIAFVPEVGVNVGLKVTDNIQLLLGYSFIYWSRVVRPGDQVDLALNPNLIPTSNSFGLPGGPRRPAVSLSETDFWAQGINLGLEFRF